MAVEQQGAGWRAALKRAQCHSGSRLLERMSELRTGGKRRAGPQGWTPCRPPCTCIASPRRLSCPKRHDWPAHGANHLSTLPACLRSTDYACTCTHSTPLHHDPQALTLLSSPSPSLRFLRCPWVFFRPPFLPPSMLERARQS